jgi:uncharacterized membrane protein
MSTLPLHPAIVHLPLGLAFVLPLVAAALALAVWRRRLPRSAFAVVVGLQAVLVAGGVIAMQLGERDAKQVEAIVGEPAVEAHEERAEAFVWVAGIVLAVSAAALLLPGKLGTGAAALTVAGTLAVTGLAIRTGEAGGELVYRAGAASAFRSTAPGGARAPAVLKAAHEDDD